MQTAYDLVWMSAERTPDHWALVDDRTDRKLTYAQLIAEIDAVAAGLAARGVGAGTRVATALPSSWEHAIALLALARLGAVPALLNFRLRPEEIAKLIEQGGIAGAIVGPQPEVAAAVKGALPANGMLLTVGLPSPERGGSGFAPAGGGAHDFAQCRGDIAKLPPAPKPKPDDLAFIFYTSGTTGLPKGVMLPHRSTEHRIVWLATHAGLHCGTHNRALGFMPLSHAIGFYGVFLVTLGFNGTFYVQSAFDPAKAVDLIERHGITYMFAIPTLYLAMALAPNYKAERMKSLQLVLWGGANLDPGMWERMRREWPCTLRHIYGTTETMCSLYNPYPNGQLLRLRPGYYSRVRVIKPNGRPDERVKPGEEGELIVDATADTVFTGYLNRPDADADKLRDGWYYTGDMVVLHPDGDVDLRGRVDDMVRSGGENIFPEEIEVVLAKAAGVAEAAVIGLPDPRWGEIAVACVVGKGIAADALDAHCRSSTLAAFKRPKAYLFLDQLPRNATKVIRRELRATAAKAREAGSLQMVGAQPARQPA